jgi:predicted transcriptional regulator
MAVDLETLTLLSEPATRRVFEHVVKNRSIRLEELMRQLDIDRDHARTTLRQLQRAQLINEKGAGIEDFNTYYVTADGLAASRKAGI